MQDTRLYDVSAVACPDYKDGLGGALQEALAAVGGLDFVKPGMKIAIKANLVAAAKPESATTVHPRLLEELCRLLTDKGATVVIGDSPGGLYNDPVLSRVYRVCGLLPLEREGVSLNRDYGQKEAVYPEGYLLHRFQYTSYLDEADAIINVCKLKCHGMMGMSAAAKNMFGTVPGTLKPEYHFRFPDYEDFSSMILDLDNYFKPTLSIADAVWGMEGNGPTGGDPRHIGVLLASPSPHALDACAAKILGLSPDHVPTLLAAQKRGLLPPMDEIRVYGDLDALALSDFRNIAIRSSLEFSGDEKTAFKRLRGKVLGALLRAKPKLTPSLCVGCGMCRDICPAKAIRLNEKKKAMINRKTCIRCFCCQEFCPKSALKVHRTLIARIAGK